MKRVLVVLAIGFNVLLVSGCGEDGNGGGINVESKNTKLSYEFEYNGCKTGKHEFSSESELCEGLRSTSLNKGCAYEMRKEAYKSYKCPGEFSSKS